MVVTIGIDAHKRSLAVCLVDELGRELAVREFANEPRSHRALHAWVVKQAPGERRFGVESTGWVGRGRRAAGRGRLPSARRFERRLLRLA